jgi:hypothetical protein
VNDDCATIVGRATSAVSIMVCPAFVPIGKACKANRECASDPRPWIRLACEALTPLGSPVVPEV